LSFPPSIPLQKRRDDEETNKKKIKTKKKAKRRKKRGWEGNSSSWALYEVKKRTAERKR